MKYKTLFLMHFRQEDKNVNITAISVLNPPSAQMRDWRILFDLFIKLTRTHQVFGKHIQLSVGVIKLRYSRPHRDAWNCYRGATGQYLCSGREEYWGMCRARWGDQWTTGPPASTTWQVGVRLGETAREMSFLQAVGQKYQQSGKY